MGAFAEFERALSVSDNWRASLSPSKRVFIRVRKKSLSTEDVAMIQQRIDEGHKKAQVAREFGISRETLYKYIE